VSAGTYTTKEQANEKLETVKYLGYRDAYVKYTGAFIK
jgi:hypothetical protein